MPATEHVATKRRAKDAKQAMALSTKQEDKWFLFLTTRVLAKIWFALWLSFKFGLRIGEALALKREDLHVGEHEEVPYIVVCGQIAGARKSPGQVYVRKRVLDQLRGFLNHGISHTIERKHKHGSARFKNCYSAPKSGSASILKKQHHPARFSTPDITLPTMTSRRPSRFYMCSEDTRFQHVQSLHRSSCTTMPSTTRCARWPLSSCSRLASNLTDDCDRIPVEHRSLHN